jgi:hypothetical protein
VTFDELERLLLQLMGTSPEALEQQMRSHIKRETLVGGKRVTRQELPELPEDAATMVHRVKVSLYGAKPPVWRRLEIPSAMPLNLVHAVLQIAFDWHDYHLHAFETVCGQFGSPDHDDDWAERQDEATATLAQVAGEGSGAGPPSPRSPVPTRIGPERLPPGPCEVPLVRRTPRAQPDKRSPPGTRLAVSPLLPHRANAIPSPPRGLTSA